MPRAEPAAASRTARDDGDARRLPPPIAMPAADSTLTARRDPLSGSRSRKSSTVALSLAVHTATLVGVTVFAVGRVMPPAAPPESEIAMVFAPEQAAAPSGADAAAPPSEDVRPSQPEEAHATPAPQPTPPAEPPPPEPQPPPPTATAEPPPEPQPPATSAEPPPPEPQAEPQPARIEPPPKPRPAPKQTAIAHARTAPASPPAAHAPPRPAAEEQQAVATGAAGPSVTAALIPPRPVAGMETNRAPIYPESALRRGEEGRVLLRVDVSAEGMPLDVSVAGTSGHPILDSAALSAVRQWRFVPGMLAGRTVAAVAEVPIRFHLEN